MKNILINICEALWVLSRCTSRATRIFELPQSMRCHFPICGPTDEPCSTPGSCKNGCWNSERTKLYLNKTHTVFMNKTSRCIKKSTEWRLEMVYLQRHWWIHMRRRSPARHQKRPVEIRKSILRPQTENLRKPWQSMRPYPRLERWVLEWRPFSKNLDWKMWRTIASGLYWRQPGRLLSLPLGSW